MKSWNEIRNAAVASSEALDGTLEAGSSDDDGYMKYVPSGWHGYTNACWAANWHRWFQGDGRRLLTWKGRFSNVTNVVNFYSTQEEVVCNGDGTMKPYGRPYSWYNQEYRKGLWPMMIHEYEGGWEFNPFHDTVTGLWVGNEYVENRQRMLPQNAANLTDEQLRQHPFFLDFANPEMHFSSNGLIVATNYLYRAEMLAYAIPSESFAAGANPLPWQIDVAYENRGQGIVGSYDMANLFDYGRGDLPASGTDPEDKHRDWQHSTFVQRSYKRTHQLFRTIIRSMKGNE